jgi:protein transport protein HofC
MAFPVALEKNAASPWLRGSIDSLRDSFRSGNTVAETVSAHPTVFSPLESGVLAVGERCGQLENACEQLASHFSLLNRLRLQTRLQLGYPLFLISFAILCSGTPVLVSKGWLAFLGATLPKLAFIGAGLLTALMLFMLGARTVRTVPFFERLILLLPVLGSLYRDWIAFRFASVFGLCTQTGLPILETLRLAGPASQSALLNRACKNASTAVLQGDTVGSFLAQTRILPDSLIPLWLSGEESGSLDRNLDLWCQNSADELRSRTETAVAFATRTLGVCVMLAIGWKIVNFAKGYFALLEQF